MPVSHRILPDRNLTIIEAHGEVQVREILADGARMIASPDWRAGMNILCDYRLIEDLDMDTDAIHRIVAEDERNAGALDGCRCAVVAEQDLVFGLARMWEMLSEGSNFERAVFRDIASAMGWLGVKVSS